jgi:hypothetical protein
MRNSSAKTILIAPSNHQKAFFFQFLSIRESVTAFQAVIPPDYLQ